MDIARVGHVQAFTADGVTEHILLRWGTFDARNLLVTWTVVSPGGRARGHSHAGSEQAYVIISGDARIQVGDERQVVSQGTLVYIPLNTPHSIANAGPDELVYISTASPPFPVERFYAEAGTKEVRTPDLEREMAGP